MMTNSSSLPELLLL